MLPVCISIYSSRTLFILLTLRIGLSCIIGHLAEAITTADEATTTSSRYVSKLLRGELERFRESIDSAWSPTSVVHVTYYHVKLLALRHNATTDPLHLLDPAQRIAAFLENPMTPITPLNHHFAALALVTLADLTEVKETQDDAWKGIEKLMEALDKRRAISSREDSFGCGWDRAIKELIERRKQARFSSSGSEGPNGQHGSLQHLAELAVGERSPTTPSPTTGYAQAGPPLLTVPHINMARLHHHGYLGALVA